MELSKGWSGVQEYYKYNKFNSKPTSLKICVYFFSSSFYINTLKYKKYKKFKWKVNGFSKGAINLGNILEILIGKEKKNIFIFPIKIVLKLS